MRNRVEPRKLILVRVLEEFVIALLLSLLPATKSNKKRFAAFNSL